MDQQIHSKACNASFSGHDKLTLKKALAIAIVKKRRQQAHEIQVRVLYSAQYEILLHRSKNSATRRRSDV